MFIGISETCQVKFLFVTSINASSLTDILVDQPGPVLTWFAPVTPVGGADRERVELGGAVASRWLAKTDNFLDAEFPYGANSFSLFLPAHWRAPFWVIASWLRGLELFPARDAANVDLVVSDDLGFLDALADSGATRVAQTLESYSLEWPELPGGLLDGIADILSYGDEVEAPHTAAPDSLVLNEHVDWVPPGLWSDPSKRELRLQDLWRKNFLRADGPPVTWGQMEGDRVLVTTADPIVFSAQLIQLWVAGASVVWVPGGGDVDSIAEVEKVTSRLPDVQA